MKIEQVVGKNLAKLRQVWPMSQSELSNRISEKTGKYWSRSVISAAESGDRAFTVRDLVMLALVFEVPVTTLLLPPNDDDGAIVLDGKGSDEPLTVSKKVLIQVLTGTDGTALRARLVPLVRFFYKAADEAAALHEALRYGAIEARGALRGDDPTLTDSEVEGDVDVKQAMQQVFERWSARRGPTTLPELREEFDNGDREA